MKRLINIILCVTLLCNTLGAVVLASELPNLKICGVDIGISAGEYMQFTNSDRENSDSGYYYNDKYLGASQCFGFARWCQYKLFNSLSLGNYDMEYDENSKNDFYWVSVNGYSSISPGKLTTNNLKSLIRMAKPGAHIRTGKTSTTVQHSMVITEITDKGFSIAQCNGTNNKEYDGYKQNYVGTYTYTWSSYISGKYGARGIAYIEMPYDYSYDVKPLITNAYAEGHNEITVKWNKVPSATKYSVERRKAGDDAYTIVKSSLTATKYTDTGLDKNQRYYYRVTAYDGSTELGTSETVGAYTKFDSPTVKTVSNSKLTISWDSVAKAESYTIKRRRNDEDEYTDIKKLSSDNTTFTDSGLNSSTRYYYCIVANCVIDDNEYIARSTIGYGYTLVDAPKITDVSGTSDSEIKVSWKNVSGATSYRLERRKAGETDYKTVKSAITGTSFVDSGLDKAYRYYYRVYAVNSVGESSASAVVGGYTKFAAPEIEIVSTSQLNISWDNVAMAESYTVNRRRYDETEYTVLKTVTDTTYTDSGLTSGYKYYYWIKANCNVGGTEIIAKSLTGGGFTRLATPTAAVLSDTSVKLTWNKIVGPGTYKYVVQKRLPSESAYSTVASVSGTTFTDTELTPEETYYYRVRIFDSNNEACSISGSVAATTLECSHEYSEWNTIVSPTCIADGIKSRTCSKCGNEEKGVISKTGKHNYNVVQMVEPTQEKDGYVEYKCVDCPETYSEVLDKKSIYTKSIVSIDQEKYIVNTQLFNIPKPFEVLVVGYNDDNMIVMKKAIVSDDMANVTLNGNINKIKVLVWENLKSLKPICVAETIYIR